MICKSCGNEINDSAKFCRFCGKEVVTEELNKCPECGQEIEGTELFCRHCGTKLKDKDGTEENEQLWDELPINIDYVDPPSEPSYSQKESKSSILWIICGMLGAILLVFWCVIGIDYIMHQRITIFDMFMENSSESFSMQDKSEADDEDLEESKTERQNEEESQKNETDSETEKREPQEDEMDGETEKESQQDAVNSATDQESGESKFDNPDVAIDEEKEVSNEATFDTEVEEDLQSEATESNNLKNETSESKVTHIQNRNLLLGGVEYQLQNGEAKVIRCNTSEAFIFIPQMVEGTPVVEIGEEAFQGCVSLQYINISEGIKNIRNCAFYDMPNLLAVNLPSSVETMGRTCFNGNAAILSEPGTYVWQYGEQNGIACWNIQNSSVSFNNHNYQAFPASASWSTAEAYCEAMGGHLATVTSSEEQQVINTIVADGSKKFYWIGATDQEVEGQWKWITGEPFNYSNWCQDPMQPDNRSGYGEVAENYASALKENGQWLDLQDGGDPAGDSAIIYAGFICEWE